MFKWISNIFSKNITSSADLVTVLERYSSGSKSGASVTPLRSLQSPTNLACINAIASDGAKLPLDLYKRGRDDARDKAKSHPLFKRLRWKSNSFQTAQQFRHTFWMHRLMYGNAYAYINRVNGEVRELLPLTGGVQVDQNDDWSLSYKVTERNGTIRNYRQQDILHWRDISLNGFLGESRIKLLREFIAIEITLAEHVGAMLDNSARPGLIIKHPGNLKKEQLLKVQEKIDAASAGARAGGTLILDERMEPLSFAHKPKEQQMFEIMKQVRRIICGGWGVPPQRVADLEDAHYNNVEHSALDYLLNTLLFYLEDFEQLIYCTLLTDAEQEDYFAEHNVDMLLKGDIETRYKAYQLAIMNGLMSPNEVRARENLGPRTDGDVFYHPVNLAQDGQGQEPQELTDSQEKRRSALRLVHGETHGA